LLTDLALDHELLPTNKSNRRAFVACKDRLVPLPKGFFMIAPTDLWSFLTSKLFSLPGKMRIILETIIPAKKSFSDDESVANFISRRFGNELLARAGQPLLGGIYMSDVNELSARSTIPYFVSLEQKYGSVIKGLLKKRDHQAGTASGARFNLFSSLNGGTETIISRLAQRLTDVQIHLKTKLYKLSPGQRKRWQLHTENGQIIEADVVILATPAKTAATIVSEVDIELGDALDAIENHPSLVINLLYKQKDIGRPMNAFGFVIPTSENKNIIACGLISKKFAHRVCPGHEMIRVFIGGQLAPEIITLKEEELKQLAHTQLAPYLRIKNAPQKTWLTRWPEGLPFYQVGHSEKVRSIEKCAAAQPGLFFAGASYYGVGIPDCIKSAETTVDKLLAYLETTAVSSALSR
jgi:oxygen-dependent protoporphyrinogen oxidase